MNSGRRFKRRFFRTSLLGRMLGDLMHRGRREQAGAAQRSMQRPGPGFALEQMEPRVLMSADIAYVPTNTTNTLTVSASSSGGAYFIDITGGSVAPVHRQLSAAGDVTINIAPFGGTTAGALLADTVRINLDTFSVLNTFVNANGGLLTLDIAGGSELIQDDHVFIDGVAASLGYGLRVHASADVTAAATATLTGDLTLASDDTLTGTSATNLKARNLTLQSAAIQAGRAVPGTGLLANADSAITLTNSQLTATNGLVLGARSVVTVNSKGIPIAAVSGAVITSASSAKINVGGASILSGKTVDITAAVDGSLIATADLSVVKLVVITGKASPEVLINGTTKITATTSLNVTAKSDILIDAAARPGLLATIAKADAAVVTTTFASGASLSVAGAANLKAGGAVSLASTSKLDAKSIADASVAGTAGASVAVSVFSGDTTASVSGATVEGASVALTAASNRVITTTAKSTPGGALDDAVEGAGQAVLAKNKAATSQGQVKFGGAVAVGTDTGATTAFLQSARILVGTGAVSVTASPVDVMTVTADGVGMSGGQTVIDRTQANVALTIDERVALAAAERLDVQFLGGALITTRVNFNAEARTITRTDGGSWIANGFQSGMYVTIDGVGQDKTQNATIRTTVFHRLVGVTATVLTIGAGSPMATETARPITIAPVVLDPNFQAMAPAVTATAFFTGGTQTNVASITRTDGGSWITSGFAAGQLLRVTGSVENSTTGSLTYRIASVSASVITLTSSARITTTEAATVSLTRGILPTITAIRISHLDDINVTASGKVDITAGKNVLLGSTTDIRINQVTAGDNVTGDKIRIKGSLSILDAAAPGLVNVRGNDVILEAAQGGVGTKADRIGITFLAGGTLTARAKDGVYVSAVNSDLRLESVYSESGDAYLTADGSILELFRNDLTKIRANRVELIAKGGAIGSGEPSGWVDIEASEKVMAEAQGGIWLWQQRGDLTLDRVLSLYGDVGLRAQGSILDDVADEDDWTGTRARPNVDVRGNAISLVALTGGIGSATSTLDIDTQYFAEGALTASSAGKNIFINEVAGTLRLNSVTTGATGTAFLTALTGGISGWPATIGPNIEAQGAVLSAVGDIGASDRRLSTKIQTIEARANPGAIWIDNMGGLSIGGDMTTQADGIVARRGGLADGVRAGDGEEEHRHGRVPGGHRTGRCAGRQERGRGECSR